MAGTIHIDHANGRTVFNGDVVIAVDGTEVTTKDVAVYDPVTNTIELANGIVRIALAAKPSALKLAGSSFQTGRQTDADRFRNDCRRHFLGRRGDLLGCRTTPSGKNL
jgi:hypothetical protein